jgi:hypothetical protein
MGIFVKQGVLNADGTVTDVIWDGFVSDVIKKMSTAQGTIPGVQIGPAVEPVAGAQALNLKDKNIFGDFHKTWRPRYEAMVRGIDADGSYKLSEFSGVPIMDPTAMAPSIGAAPPPMSIGDALAEMAIPANPKLAPPLFFTEILADPKFTTVEKLPEMSDQEFQDACKAKEDESKLKFVEALAIPPVAPIPQIPDVKILELGYTEQYTNEINSALSPTLAYPAMIGPGLAELAGAILDSLASPPDLPKKVMKVVGDQNAKVAPPSMETSDFEKSVNSVFEEHRAKYTAAVMLAQNIGHGTVVDALSATPFDQFGFEIMREPEEPEPAATVKLDPLSGRRYKILKIIQDYIGKPPFAYVSILEDPKKFEQVTGWSAPTAAKEANDVKEEIKKLQEEKNQVYNPSNNAPQLNSEQKKAKLDELNKKIKDTQGVYSEKMKNMKFDKPVATTCNAFPAFVIARKLGMKPKEYTLSQTIDYTLGDGTKKKNEPLQLVGGLDSMRKAGRLRNCWVDAMSNNGAWDPKVGLPKMGDVLLLSMGNKLFSNSAAINLEKLRSQGGEPWDTDARHVGFLFDDVGIYFDYPEEDGEDFFWLTADAGQGSVALADQRVAYVIRPIRIPGRHAQADPKGRIMIMGEPDYSGKRNKRAYLAGWLDVDKLSIENEAEIF